ncbi:hypothetical protein ACH4B4_36085, partial [Streptomyces tendae]
MYGVGGPPVEDIDGVLMVRSVGDDSFPLDTVAEVAHAVGTDGDVVTVVVGSVTQDESAAHWARLGALLDSLRARDVQRIRLVMSGAGDDRPRRPSIARRIADAWELEVTAPDGAVLFTPGGTLFAHGEAQAAGCAWWRFAPGEEPRRLGPRAPAPGWEEALARVPEHTTDGCVVERVPAGVLIRPADAPLPALDDLCFSVPVDTERLTVLVGAPQAEDITVDDVVAVLAGLPQEHRSRARLAPGGRRDLLRLGQSVADRTGAEVEVLTGVPMLDDQAPIGTPPRPMLVGADGRPSWRPFVPSVICGPADATGRPPLPRLMGIRLPDWLLAGTDPGTVRLTDRWQATVTRAGLALWAQDQPRPGLFAQAVDPEVCAVELGTPGQPLDSTLLPALGRLLSGLDRDARARTTLLVRGRLPDGDGDLRRLAAEHGVPNIRYVTAVRPAAPGASVPPARPAPDTGRSAPPDAGDERTAGPGLPSAPGLGVPEGAASGAASSPVEPAGRQRGRPSQAGDGLPARHPRTATDTSLPEQAPAPRGADRPAGTAMDAGRGRASRARVPDAGRGRGPEPLSEVVGEGERTQASAAVTPRVAPALSPIPRNGDDDEAPGGDASIRPGTAAGEDGRGAGRVRASGPDRDRRGPEGHMPPGGGDGGGGKSEPVPGDPGRAPEHDRNEDVDRLPGSAATGRRGDPASPGMDRPGQTPAPASAPGGGTPAPGARTTASEDGMLPPDRGMLTPEGWTAVPGGRTASSEGEAPGPGGGSPVPEEGRTPPAEGGTPAVEGWTAALEEGTSGPGAGLPVPEGRTAAPGGEAPAPEGGLPVVEGRTAVPGGEVPAVESGLPVPESERTASGGGSPVPEEGRTPPAEGGTPAVEGWTAAPEEGTSGPGVALPVPEGRTAVPGGEAPAPEGGTPAVEGWTAAPEEGTSGPGVALPVPEGRT